jgi:hypothetical protein
MKSKTQKPLATISGPVKAKLYRGKFRPFEAIKYLNAAVLKQANKARIEIGSIEAAGMKVTVAAEVRKGLITEIRPLDCTSCGNRKTKRKHSKAIVREVALQALKRAHALNEPTVRLPIPIARLATDFPIEIDIGPIVIILDDGGFDICIMVDSPGGGWCLYCLFGASVCGGGQL